jgi:hypothetical protein
MGRLSDAQPNGAGGGDLKPGETRTILAKDKHGNVLKTMILTRTERPYVYDLCDCYNAYRTQDAIDRGVEWFVAPNGELRIGTSAEWTAKNLRREERRLETERARHNRLTLEAERRSNAYQRDAAE